MSVDIATWLWLDWVRIVLLVEIDVEAYLTAVVVLPPLLGSWWTGPSWTRWMNSLG